MRRSCCCTSMKEDSDERLRREAMLRQIAGCMPLQDFESDIVKGLWLATTLWWSAAPAHNRRASVAPNDPLHVHAYCNGRWQETLARWDGAIHRGRFAFRTVEKVSETTPTHRARMSGGQRDG